MSQTRQETLAYLIKKAGRVCHKVHRKYEQQFDCPGGDETAGSGKVCRHRLASRSCADLSRASKRDIIPGLEVRLLNHQCIGVAWYGPFPGMIYT